jgi:DNA-binding MarR family transcriptional regulator
MDDQRVAPETMVRTVKRARSALVEAVRRRLGHGERSVPRAAHTQVFENLDPGGTRLTVLAERTQMSHQAMGEMIDELVRHGYLERVPDPDDRRARLIRATGLGRTELTRAGEHIRALHDRWERELDGITVAQVIGALEVLIRVCEEPGGESAQQR